MALPVALLSAVLALFAVGCGRTSLLGLDASTVGSGARSDSSSVATGDGAGMPSATSQPSSNGICPPGFTWCGRRCYDLTRSPEHCGQCRNACAPGIACRSSRCEQYRCKGALTFNALPAIATAPPTDDSAQSLCSYLPVLGDFDGDGTLDFVGQTGVDAPMGLLLGNGDGTFEPRALASEFASAWQAAAADVNGDGRLDLATTTVNQPWVTVRIGTADSTAVFEPAVSYPSPASPFALLLADLDDDGHSDLVVGGTRVTLWRGAADGKFGEPEDIPIGLSLPWSGTFFLGAADWNRDGVLDLVYGTSTLRISLGRADGTFDKEVACGLALDRHAAGNVVADFDHDQKMDLVVLKTGILLGMNGCNFSSLVTLPVPPTHVSLDAVGVADLDGDGHADIVSATGNADNGQTTVNLGDGHGGFAPPANFPSTGRQSAGPFLLGDLNHDGKVDIIVTRSDGWRVLLNTCP